MESSTDAVPPYVHRVAEASVQRYLTSFPVVGVTGPRQSGKSTMLRNLLPDYDYVTFDDFQKVDFFKHDPVGFMQRYSEKVIFDEVQFVPEIFNQLKLAVDQHRHDYGRFVVTGSNQFAYVPKASESLAGRIGLFQLLPYQFSELPVSAREQAIYRGSYPELVNRDYAESDLWYGSYLDTYLNKDLRALANIGDLRDFRRLVSLLAANIGQQLNYSSYASDIGVSVPTVKRWVSLLEASYIIFLVPPYFKNFGKRIVKSPKVYFCDTGLCAFLTGVTNWDQYDKGPMAGALFENYVVSGIKKNECHRARNSELFYLRTSDQKEIDLIVDRKASRDMIEIKKTETFRPLHAEPLELFMEGIDQGFVLYNGESVEYKKGIQVINYQYYLR